MAATTDWATYYRDRCQDKGAIDAFFPFEDEGITVAKVHNNKVGVVLGTEQ